MTTSKKSVDRDLENIFTSVVEAAHHITALPVSIWAPNKTGKALRIVESFGLPANYVRKARLRLDEPSVTGDSFKNQRPEMVIDISNEHRWKYKDEAKRLNWKSVVCVPIITENIAIGVISAYAYSDRRLVELLDSLSEYANQVALNIIANRRGKTLKKLLEISNQMRSVSKSPKVVLNLIAREACDVTGADCAVIYPYDVEKKEFYNINNIAHFGLKTKLSPSDRPRRETGMAAYIKREAEVIVFDIEKEDPQMLNSSFIKREGVKAFIGIALSAENTEIGVLYVDFRSPHIFTEEEKEIVRLFAQQASITVHNSRLYEQALIKAKDLEKIQKVGATLVSIPRTTESLRTTLRRIARDTQKVLGADLVDLYQYFEDQDKYDLPPVQVGKRKEPKVTKKEIQKDDVIWSIVESKQPQYILDSQEEKGLNTPFKEDRTGLPVSRFVIREEIKSTTAIPLVVGNEVVGVLFANYRTPQTFLSQQKNLTELFATQAAIAIWNARLYTRLQERLNVRLADISTFQQIYKRIYSASHKELMSLIAKKATALTGAKYAVLWLVDKDGSQLKSVGVAGDDRPVELLPRLPLNKNSINGWVMQTGKYYLCNDTKSDPHYRSWYEDALSELAVPLYYERNVIGTLDVESTSVNNFTDDHLALLEAMATQAVIVIQNSKIVKKLDTLDDVGRALTNTIRLQEPEILELIQVQASGLMDTDNMYIALYDEETEAVSFGLAYVNGKKVNINIEEGWQPRKAGKGKTEEIIRSKRPIFHATKDEAEAWYAQPGRIEYIGNPLPSWIGVPMKVGKRVIGVIATYHPQREFVYSRDDLEILQAMANQAAIAIDNARMANNLFNVNRQLETVQRLINAVEIHADLHEFLQDILEDVLKLINAKNGTIQLYDSKRDELIVLAKVGKIINHNYQRIPLGIGVTGKAAKEKIPVYIPDIKVSPDYLNYIPNTLSEFAVPMLIGNTLIGVLNAEDNKEFAFTSYTRQLIERIASQVAILIRQKVKAQEIEEKKLVNQVNESLGLITAEVAHKVGNAAGKIRYIARERLYNTGNLDEQQQNDVQIILRNVEDMINATEDLFKPFGNEPQAIISIDEMITVAKNQCAAPREIRIVTSYAQELPKVNVQVAKVQSYFTEILDNAIKYTRKGMNDKNKALEEIHIQAQRGNDGFVEVFFTNHGPAIPHERWESIFRVFSARGQKFSEDDQNYGLGLWGARATMKQQGGDVHLLESDDLKTTFMVRLPPA